MKKIIILLLLTAKGFSQDFEGKIEYTMSYSAIGDNQIDTIALKKTMGSKSTFTTKKGAYKQTTDSGTMTLQLYIPRENRLYVLDSIKPDQLFYYRGDKVPNAEFEYEIIENAATISGYPCHQLIYKGADFTMTFFYAPALKLNPKYFKDFSLLNKNKITSLMKSVFLKSEFYFPDFIATMEATKVEKAKIEDSEFTKPKTAVVREK